MVDYANGAADGLHDRKIETFDFQVLSGAFDAARSANPSVRRWSLTDALLDAHLAGSDQAALGGDLAYQYGLRGTLAGIGIDAARGVLGSALFGAQAQPLRPAAELQQDVNRLV
jgi:hypothetical protein